MSKLHLSRERLRATGPEFVSLLRMLMNDRLGYIPGWYWFSRFEEGEVETVILHLAFSDTYDSVKIRAFDLLSAARIPLPDEARERMVRVITSDSAPEIRKAALAYIGSSGGQVYLPVVGIGLVDRNGSVSSQAKLSEYLLIARTEPERALSKLLGETGVEVEGILRELTASAGEIAATTLLRALENSKDEIRFFAIKELIRRNELTVELAILLKEDKYDPVKAAAYRFLIERGAEINDEDIAWKLPNDYFSRIASRNLIVRPSPPIEREQIVLEFYRRYDTAQLVPMADWDRLAGHEAYRALAIDHFPEFAEKLREDLRTDFAVASEGYYQSRLEEWRRLAATPITPTNVGLLIPSKLSLLSGRKQDPVEQKPTPESMARDEVAGRKVYYLAAALAGLAQHGSAEDVEFGRHLLPHSDNDVRIEAVRVIRQCGNEDDVPTLIKVAKSSDGLLQELAADAALTISGYQHGVVAEFLATGNEILASITVAKLIEHGNKAPVGEFLRQYLYSDDEKVRTRVLAFFVFRYDDQELESLLAQYTNEAVYYFDVVGCFDRILYAPPRLRSFYRESVKDNFFGLLV